MVTTALMMLGAVGALLPLVGRRVDSGPVRWAHLCMGIVMAAMVVVGMDSTTALVSSVVLVVSALHVTAKVSQAAPSSPCAVDLTCMAVLLLLMPSIHAHSGARTTSADPVHRHTAGLDPRLVVLVLLVGWSGSTLYIFRRSRSGRRAAAGSLLMIFGMTPIVL